MRIPPHVAAFAVLITLVCGPGLSRAEEPDSSDLGVIAVRDARWKDFDPAVCSTADPLVCRGNSARLMERIPGGAVVSNGPLTEQIQYRGLHGARVNVRLDGAKINPSCPNWMDAPMHYAPPSLIDRFTVERGAASVASGAEAPGGTVTVQGKTSRFGEGSRYVLHGDIEMAHATNGDALDAGGLLAVANDRFRAHLLGSFDDAENFRSASGTVRPSQRTRRTAGGGVGLRSDETEFAIDYRHHETDKSGTPSFAMDMASIDAHLVNAGLKLSAAGGRVPVSLSGYFSDVDHIMDNYSLRVPTGMRMHTFARSRGFGGELNAVVPLGDGGLTAGVDFDREEQDKEARSPSNAAFYATSYNGVVRQRSGGYLEWSGTLPFRPIDRDWNLELGARVVRLDERAEPAALSTVMNSASARNLRDAFNMGTRDLSGTDWDLVAKVGSEFSPSLLAEIGYARKTRFPGYVERFGWLPTSASNGLADGRIYVGDVNLRPEVSHEGEIGIFWRRGRFAASPRFFYRRIDDYIQGVPYDNSPGIINSDVETVAAANGDSYPLRFGNVDATFYGLDLGWSYAITDRWTLSGLGSYVRGTRADIADNLYRIAPANGRVDLTYARSQWDAGVEVAGALRQNRVAATNGEKPTPGWAILNAHASWRPLSWIETRLSVENILDRAYADHLNGPNRVAGSAVPVGARVPSPGRNVEVRMNVTW